MNEIKKCSIAGVSFTLEYDAYDALNAYIESLNDTYKDDPAARRSSPTSRPASPS